jgi:hypothetical protein
MVDSFLLYILNLLLNTVDLAFYINNITGRFSIGGLARNGVRFSEHFLADEVQPASGLVGSVTTLFKLLQM